MAEWQLTYSKQLITRCLGLLKVPRPSLDLREARTTRMSQVEFPDTPPRWGAELKLSRFRKTIERQYFLHT